MANKEHNNELENGLGISKDSKLLYINREKIDELKAIMPEWFSDLIESSADDPNVKDEKDLEKFIAEKK